MLSEKILEYLEKDISGYSPVSVPISPDLSLKMMNPEGIKTISIEADGPRKPKRKFYGYKEKAEQLAKEILGKNLKQDKRVSSFYRAEKQLEKAKLSVSYFEPRNLGKCSVGERAHIRIDVEKNEISSELKAVIEKLDSISL